MSAEMTLEQASKRLKELSVTAYCTAKRTLGNQLGVIADAIDAHLAKAGETIHVNATDSDDSILYVYPPGRVKAGDKLYAAPPSAEPAQTVEAVDALQLCITELLHDGVPTDPVHPRRVALNAAEAALAHPRPTGEVVALLAEAKSKLARAVGTAEAGPSKLWKYDVNSAAWDIKRAIDALSAPTGEQAGEVDKQVQPKLIGWRMADYTAETSDPDKAKNWSANVPVLPIFEGDPNTKLTAAPAPVKE